MGRHAIRLAATTALERGEGRCHFSEVTPKLKAAATSMQASSGETSVSRRRSCADAGCTKRSDGTTGDCNDCASQPKLRRRVGKRRMNSSSCRGDEQPYEGGGVRSEATHKQQQRLPRRAAARERRRAEVKRRTSSSSGCSDEPPRGGGGVRSEATHGQQQRLQRQAITRERRRAKRNQHERQRSCSDEPPRGGGSVRSEATHEQQQQL